MQVTARDGSPCGLASFVDEQIERGGQPTVGDAAVKAPPRTSAALEDTGHAMAVRIGCRRGDDFEKAVCLFGSGPLRRRLVVVGVLARI
jgi:hypothetical protein